ncbi:UDP-2,3-diacylglucosamine diphosphatase LpxI [Siccirubricoccus sp. KC 17139]|uniref:UDP-2,3-diacylglucosamine diphosphatase LpxI n=1 Tax=Siccirubricoccus soli TaxID=2899147 RepID=A0ABT1DCX0_9PROT|nr:UDP-2,3-diacylglucosamine diphosphatase LpxI [Siccirubricoccus soli]MCO6419065.1 UDP-2,3-diacylglucosamine diphosphatase LpxI [Siccirubricoccus soli]MCP2685200.1 UDP-2,3-diacylglucosamine diphosphatase LpxI [Siccirubricoccus soli]
MTPLGIVAGSGEVPLRVACAAQAAGRPVFAALLDGFADPADWAGIPHIRERVGAAGAILAAFRARGIRQLVLSGGVQRPSLLSLRPDAAGARLLARIGRAYFQGDDGLLRAVARALEAEGFEVVAAHAVMADLIPSAGQLGAVAPDAQARADIARAIAVVRALGAVDVGQGAVVQQGLVLGVEAIEGTDALLARCAGLRREGPGGVLVKLVKPGQDRRLDLPTIGPSTIAGAKAAGLAGIAIEAGGSILVDRPATLAAADAAGIFLLAIDPDQFKETMP